MLVVTTQKNTANNPNEWLVVEVKGIKFTITAYRHKNDTRIAIDAPKDLVKITRETNYENNQ